VNFILLVIALWEPVASRNAEAIICPSLPGATLVLRCISNIAKLRQAKYGENAGKNAILLNIIKFHKAA
jgi:hypothetical protein